MNVQCERQRKEINVEITERDEKHWENEMTNEIYN